jgi:anti-sigma28 factor (negative regulator of flagellin synthesis)
MPENENLSFSNCKNFSFSEKFAAQKAEIRNGTYFVPPLVK